MKRDVLHLVFVLSSNVESGIVRQSNFQLNLEEKIDIRCGPMNYSRVMLDFEW